jgi:hypothetical protein
MPHNQFLNKKVDGGYQMQNGINLEGQNRAIITWVAKMSNC